MDDSRHAAGTRPAPTPDRCPWCASEALGGDYCPYHNPGAPMALQIPADTLVVFTDDAGTEYRCQTVRLGHTDREVRAVAYRWACKQVAEGAWMPHGELAFRSIGPLL